MKDQIKVGDTVIFDGFVWGIVDGVDGKGNYWVIDQDGGEHEITDARIDSVNHS